MTFFGYGIYGKKEVNEINAVTAALKASAAKFQAVLAKLPNSAEASPSGKENTSMSATPTPLDAAIAALTAQATANETVEGQAATLISGFAQMITDANNDPAVITNIVAQMNASAAALQAQVNANTATPAPATTTAALKAAAPAVK